MLADNKIKELIQESFDSLYESGMIESKITVEDDTVLLGTGSPLDSVSFVTLFMDIEDRIKNYLNQDIYLLLSDIHEFNPDDKHLSMATLISYIRKIYGETGA